MAVPSWSVAVIKAVVLALCALPSSLAAQAAAQLILCDIRGGETFEVEIGAPSEFGPLSCFHAPGIYDMTPCAPSDGWGLSFASGTVSLASVATHGMGINHSGGMFWSAIRPTQILAAAAFGETSVATV